MASVYLFALHGKYMTQFTSPDGKFTWNGSSWVPVHSVHSEQGTTEVNDLVNKKLTELEQIKENQKERALQIERQREKQQQQKIQPMIDKLRQSVLELVNSRSPESFSSPWQVGLVCNAFQVKNFQPSIPYFILKFRTKVKTDPSNWKERRRPPWITSTRASWPDNRLNVGTWPELLPESEMRESFRDGYFFETKFHNHNEKLPHNKLPYQISRLLPLTAKSVQPLSEELREIVSINYSLEHDMIVYSTQTKGVFLIENVSELYLDQHTFFHKSNRILSTDYGKINVARFCESTDEIILGSRKSGLLIYSIKSRNIKKQFYVDGEITAAVYDKNVANYIVGTKYGDIEVFNEDGENIDKMSMFRTEDYECYDPIEELLIDPNGALVIYPYTGFANPELSRPVYAISYIAPNLFNNGILDEKNGFLIISDHRGLTCYRYKQDENITTSSGSPSNFLRPHYPEVTNCSLSEMEEVLRQVNNEINRSGLNLISNDYLNFTLFWSM